MAELYELPLLEDANLQAYYRFESGALTTDSSGNSKTLSDHGSIAVGTGRFGGGAELGASNTTKWYSIADSLSIDGGAMSFGCWINLTTAPTTGNQQHLLYTMNNTSKVQYSLLYINDGGTLKLQALRNKEGVGQETASYTVTLTTGVWYHVVMTYDGTDIVLYLNNNEVATATASGSGSSAGAAGTGIGATVGGAYKTSATMDDVVIFDRELTSDERFDLWQLRQGLSDGVTFDSDGLALGSNKKIVDAITFTEALANSVNKKITDAISIVEELQTIPLYFTETVSIVDEIQKTVQFHIDLSDSIAINEGAVLGIGYGVLISDNLSIAETLANETSLRLSDSIAISVSLFETEFLELPSLKSHWRFFIRSSSGDYLASLVNARARWFKEALNHGGSAGFILDTTDTNCNETILAINSNELVIQYRGYDMFGGQISTIKKVADGNNKYWEVTCSQFFNLLHQRYCGYNKSTGISDPREFTTTDAGTIAWTLIDEAQNEVNGDMGITAGTIQASVSRTKTYEKANIAEAIIELADNDYGFDFEITSDKVFNVYYPFKGTTRDEVVFRYPGNCLRMECMENGLDVVNHELGLGRHWGGQEIYYIVDDATSQLAYGRREKIESYKDVEIQAFLTSMVTQDVDWNKNINKVIKFSSFVDTKTDLYKYELGDSVKVVADDFNINESLFVYERQVTIDDNDDATVTLTLGD